MLSWVTSFCDDEGAAGYRLELDVEFDLAQGVGRQRHRAARNMRAAPADHTSRDVKDGSALVPAAVNIR
jgi:hypothetical protein